MTSSAPGMVQARRPADVPTSPPVLDLKQEERRIQRVLAELRALGFPLLPAHHPGTPLPAGWRDADNGKRPALAKWTDRQDRHPTPEEERTDFAELRNPGMPTGAISGVVVLDLDDAEAIEWADANVPPTPVRSRSGSGRGEHRYYRFNPARPIGNKARLRTRDGRKIMADIRGQGGFILLPGARHVSGGVYEMVSPWTVEALTNLPELPEELIAGGVKIPPPPPEFRYTAGGDLGHVVERARRYLDTVEPAIQGEGGDQRTFRAACILVNDFALPVVGAWSLLLEWNARCIPPWSEKDLRQKLRNADKYARQAQGGREAVPAPFLSASLGKGPIDREKPEGGKLLSVYGSVTRETESKNGGFRFRTAKEIGKATPEAVDWLLKGYIATGAITELDAKPKAGKTSWLLRLIRALTTGGVFMGERVKKCRVVLLSEQNDATLAPALESAGLLDSDDLSVLFWHETGAAPWATVCAAAEAECERIGARLLVVDTFGQFAALRDENAAAEVLAAVQPLQRITAEGRAVLLARHDRKSGGDVGDSGRGSNALTGAVDIVLAMTRMESPQARPEMRNLRALSRFGETPQDAIIELEGLDYTVHDRSAVAVQNALAALENILPSDEETALSEKEILDRLAPSKVKRPSLLKALKLSKRIRVTGAGKRGDPFRYWMLHPSSLGEVGAGRVAV